MHSFDVEIAKKHGVYAAIIYQNILYWVTKNEANEKNYQDGKYWTYCSIKAFQELFPYMSTYQIRTALKTLIEADLIVTQTNNKAGYDRTLWYSLKSDKCICRKPQMDLSKTTNAFVEKHKPIPYIKTNINTDIKREGAHAPAPAETDKPLRQKKFTPPTVEEVKAYCLERKNNIGPEAFWDYYEARGWELSKGRKMKDWRACVRTWEKKSFDNGGALSKKQKWREQKDAYIHGDRTYTDADLFDVFNATEVQDG